VAVPAGAITRCSITYRLNGVRINAQIHHQLSENQTDEGWRLISQSVAARLCNRLLQWQVVDLILESLQARVITNLAYPGIAVAADEGASGHNNDTALHQGIYMWVGLTGLALASQKPYRNGVRLCGIGRSHISRNTFSQEICAKIEDIFRKEIGLTNDSPDPYPAWPRPGYCCVHWNPETELWMAQRIQNVTVSGPVKTLGGRFYPN